MKHFFKMLQIKALPSFYPRWRKKYFPQITTMAWRNHQSYFGSSMTIPRSTVAFPDNNLPTDFSFQTFILDLIISTLCTKIEDCGAMEMLVWQVECKMEN